MVQGGHAKLVPIAPLKGSTMARHALYAVLVLLMAIATLPARAQDAAIPSLPDPILVTIPKVQKFEGRQAIGISLQSDSDRCRTQYGDNWYYSCARSLNLIGKKVTAGITLDPPAKGTWRWDSDYYLTFTPDEPWQAGTSYSLALDLDKMGVPRAVRIDGENRTATLSLTSEPLTLKFENMRYMQDPDDAGRKLISARIAANYPFVFETLKSRIKLTSEQGEGNKIKSSALNEKIDLTADDGNNGAFLTIPVKSLPSEAYFTRATIESGVEPLKGGKPTEKTFTERTRIPTLDSYLAPQDTAIDILRLDDGTPQQALSFATNVKVKPADIVKHAKLYLLPAQHPVTQRNKTDKKTTALYEWKADNEITPEILAQSETIALAPMAGAGEYETNFAFPLTAPPQRYAYLTVDAALGAFGGYTLGRPFTAIIKLPSWPNDIRIMQDGSILTLSGARKISLHARGTDKLSVAVAHIRGNALSHFVSQTEGDIRVSEFRNWNFGAEDIAELDTKDIPMNLRTPQDAQYAAFDFAPYMKDGRKGLFLLNIQGYREDKPLQSIEQRFVLVTDIGLLIKQNRDKTRHAFLMSFTTGAPVADADVAVLGRNGLPVFTGKTDADGHVAIPSLDDQSRDRAPVAIVAEKGNDLTFIPYDRNDRNLNLSDFEIGGAATPAEGINAFLFSDRGIYRPGETVNLGMIIRNADWAPLPADMPLQLIINDARGRTVKDEIVKFPAASLLESTLETGETSATGTYRAHIHIPGTDYPGTMLGSASFRVEDFQPDRLKIKTLFKPAESRGWIKPDGLTAHVTLTNLYGTPATARRIAGAVTLNPADLSFPGFDDYVFHDAYPAAPRTVEYDLPDATTDAKGEATLKLNIDQQEKSTYSLNLQTRGFEAGSGRGVTTYSTATVSPMDHVVGHKTDARLDYLKKGEKYNVDLIALSPTLDRVGIQGLKLDLVRRTYVSSLVRQGNGGYSYESVPREETVEIKDFTIPEAGTILTLPTAETGQYSFVLRDGNDLTLATIPFAVAGEGGDGAGKDREAVLDIRIDKQVYAPGEDIEISIAAPYSGAGLITLESDHVIARKWFKSAGTNTVQSIAVPADFAGKGYVSVSFVRDVNSKEIYLSPLSHAVVPFTANTEKRTMKIDLMPPLTVKPGEPVTVAYKGSAPGKAIIFAVDEGILQVARYKTPDPVNFFLLDRALQVETAQMLDLLMPEYDLIRTLSADGGDAQPESAALGKHLNPFKRKTLAPAVYWSGIVDIGTDEKTVTFTPPGHFNGEMRVMAVAVADGAVGSAEAKITVRGDLVVTPNLPLFMAPGDQSTVSVTVANSSGSTGNIEFAIKTEGGIKVDKTLPALKVEDGAEETVTFPVTATDEPGPASLLVTATHGALSQTAEATLSIRPATPRETTLTAGYAEKGKVKVDLVRSLYPQLAERSVALSSLPSTYIYGLMRYLDEFPYGCTEQLISKALPQLALANRPEFSSAAPDVDGAIAGTIAELRLRQTPEGGFSLWDGGQTPDDFATLYALDFLVGAMEGGHPVPARMVEDGLRYLRDWVNQSIGSYGDAVNRSYGIYILTRSGIVTSNEILHVIRYFDEEKFTEWKQDLPAAYIAAAYKLMQQSAMADKTLDDVVNGMRASKMTFGDTTWDYNPFVITARALTIISRHFPERAARLDNEIILKIAAYVQESRYNTLSAAFAVEGLATYAAAADKDIAAAAFTLEVDGKRVDMNDKLSSPLPVTAKNLEIEANSKRPLFYMISESGFDRSPAAKEAADKLEIERAYTAADGKALSGPVKVGDIINTTITIRAHGNDALENIAIVDLIPGGFDIEPPGDAPDESTFPALFTERREDRIIAFGTADTEPTTVTYRLRATSAGTYVTPAAFAESMYDLTAKARGNAGSIIVEDAQ